jgi:hypothetical protein
MEDAGLLRALSERGYPKLVVRTDFLQGEY